MSTDPACEQMTAFADGELAAAEAEAFRDHLGRCPSCQTGLLATQQLMARLSTLPYIEPPENWEPRVLAAIARDDEPKGDAL